MKTNKRHILASAIAVAATAGLSASVQAQVYAVSYGNVFNLLVTSTDEFDGSGPFYIPLADFTDFTATSATSALLDGVGDPANPANAASTGGPANALPAFGNLSIFPGAAPADNAMTPLGQAGGANYSRGDAQVPTTAIEQATIGGPVTATGNLTQAWNVAESYIDANGFANAAALNSSETGFNTTLTLNQAARMNFQFDADPYLYVEMGALAAGGTANANLDVTFTITSGGTTVFSWSPDGSTDGAAGIGGTIGGFEFSDPADLNRSIEVTTPGATSLYDPTGDDSAGTITPASTGVYSARTNTLPPGVYTLSIDTLSNVNVLTALGPPVTYDYGDNPDGGAGTGSGNYRTRDADGGAQHQIAGPYLGACVDADDGTLQNANADADDGTAGIEVGTCTGAGDEDGVTLPAIVMPGNSYNAQINMGTSTEDCVVNGFMDFNADGDFNDAGETIVNQTLSQGSGTNTVNFAVPNNAVIGPLYSRFRCSRVGGLSATGLVDNGEVEDYRIEVVPEDGEREVPALGTWGLVLLTLILAGIGGLRRKQIA